MPPEDRRAPSALPPPARRGDEGSGTGNGPSIPDEITAAVALDYDPLAGDTAPRVVASGRGFVAEQIVQLAFAHGVQVRKDADLVEILSAVEIDSEIPVEAFMAVAEILAYVYHVNNNSPFGPPGALPPPQPGRGHR